MDELINELRKKIVDALNLQDVAPEEIDPESASFLHFGIVLSG